MQPKIHCFTLKANSRLRAIITDCTIHPGFDPKGDEKHPGRIYKALWDTGATGSVITQKIVDECGHHAAGDLGADGKATLHVMDDLAAGIAGG